MRRLALAEGIPTDAPASDILAVARYHRIRERQAGMSLAISIFNGLAVAIGGGDTDNIIAPFLSEREREEMRERREEQEQIAAQRAQVAKLMQWGRNNG